MIEGGAAGTVAEKGVLEENSHHHFQLTLEGESPYTTEVAVSVESDCTVELEFALPGDGTPTAVKLRGMLVDAGKEILAIQTDPGAVVSARFTVK